MTRASRQLGARGVYGKVRMEVLCVVAVGKKAKNDAKAVVNTRIGKLFGNVMVHQLAIGGCAGGKR